jgi:hypothetical protein
MRIKGMQVSNNSSDKKWDNNFKIYFNPEKAKAGIIATRVKSAKEKDLKMLPLSAIRMIKKKVKFEKGMAAPKIPRFNKYIQRAIEENLLKARKPNSYIVIFLNSISVTVLRLKIKKAAALILPKGIHSSLSINSNRRVLVKVYTVTSRRLKDEIKAGLNIKKLLTIIISTQIESVTVGDLMANCPYMYKTFFERATPENRKKKKDSAIMNSMRTGVSVRAVSFRENPIVFRTLFRIIITLDDSIELRGLINSNAEINYIDKITYKQLTDVVMILSLNMEMISYSNHRVPFIRICENVRLAVKFIEYEICLFIIDVKTSYFLVLDTLFIFQSDLSLGTEKDTGR